MTAAASANVAPPRNGLQRRDGAPGVAGKPAGAPKPQATAAPARSAGQAVSVTLSNQARAALATRSAADPAGEVPADTSLAGLAQRKTDALAERLASAFKNLGMPLDDETTLKLDSFGNVTTDSPYKKKIEKYFSLDPEAAKAFREVASLNAMRAAQRALEMYAEEKRRASTDDEKTLAFNRYTARGIVIQNLSGEMSFQDGKLTSASMTYISAISDLRGSKAPDRGAAPVSLLV